MNSKFTVSDLSGYSPLDLGEISMMAAPPSDSETKEACNTRTRKRKNDFRDDKAAKKIAEEFKVFIQPSLLGRRVDPTTRRIFPTIERLPVEPHSFNLIMEPLTPALLAKEDKMRKVQLQQEKSKKITEEQKTVSNDNTCRAERTPMAQRPVKTEEISVSQVRLASGKIVHIPSEKLKQLIAQQAKMVNGHVMNGDASLSQVLKTITPRQPNTEVPILSRQVAGIRTPSTTGGNAVTNMVPISNILRNGRIPHPATANHRFIKIKAHPGPERPQATGYNGIRPPSTSQIATTAATQLPLRLSERLNMISSSGKLASPAIPEAKQEFDDNKSDANVRLAFVASPKSKMSPVSVTTVVNGQRLSTALSNMQNQPRIISGQRGGHYILLNPSKSSNVISPTSNSSPLANNALSRVQLSPIFTRKVAALPTPNESSPTTAAVVVRPHVQPHRGLLPPPGYKHNYLPPQGHKHNLFPPQGQKQVRVLLPQ